jgi:signal transduction histidine kinase
MALSQLRSDGEGARRTAYEIACKLSAATLGVDRVSIWYLAREGEELVCSLQYERKVERFTQGGTLLRADCPRYFAAMTSRRVIAAHDALRDDSTSDLGAYLRQGNVGALLDAPIYRDGAVIGVVCHEQLGGPRTWSERDASFASAVADMLTILLEQADRAELRALLAAERQMQARAEKMEALQRLARVVAHDLNNVLCVALNQTQLIAAGLEAAESSREVSDVIAYGAKLVKQLSDFCNDRRAEQGVDLGHLVAGLEPALRALMGKSIRLEIDVEPGACPVNITAAEAEQLVLNLCMNAKDAITGAGVVRVAVRVEPSAGNAILEVSDSGSGMDESTQLRIFEPYFTTKSQHTGVGLMAVYGIVQRSRGSIYLDSAPGAGTTFRISVPMTLRESESNELPWSF